MGVYPLPVTLERLDVERRARGDQPLAFGFAPGFQLFRLHAVLDHGVLSLVHDF